jgi:hypothetical protein
MISLEINFDYIQFYGFGLDVIAETTSTLALIGLVIAWKIWKNYK